MTKHKANGTACLVMHYDGEGQCIGCTCGEFHRPSEFDKLASGTDMVATGCKPQLNPLKSAPGR